MSHPFSLLPALLALALGGCAGGQDFPSLAPRPIEKAVRDDADGTAPAIPAADVDPGLRQRLDAIVASGESAHRAFGQEIDRGRGAIERAVGAAAGSEAWVAGQQALSAVDSARGGILAALADLDALRRERAETGSSADLAALDAVAARLGALEAEETQAVAALTGRLG